MLHLLDPIEINFDYGFNSWVNYDDNNEKPFSLAASLQVRAPGLVRLA